jgi:peptidyl-prolyl cis-trans isomerase D
VGVFIGDTESGEVRFMVMEKLREGSKSWVAKILLAAIILPFAFFGIQYYFDKGGITSGDTVIKGGDGLVVTQGEFTDALKNRMEQMRASNRGQPLDDSLLDNAQLRQQVMNGLINSKLLTAHANKVGLEIAPQQLADIIARMSVFQENGVFKNDQYVKVLRANNMTPAVFEERLRQDIKTQWVEQSLMLGNQIPEASVKAFMALAGQTREVSLARIPLDSVMAQITIDAAAIKQYYDAHSDNFKVAERARVKYVVLSQADLGAAVAITPAEVKAFYDDPANRARFSSGETRRASHILVAMGKDRAAARDKAAKILAEVRAKPAQFAALARQYSEDPGSAANGGDLGFFGKGAMTPPFEQAAFALGKGQISDLVETQFGFHIIQLVDIKGGQAKSLAQVTPEITTELKKRKLTQAFSDRAAQFNDLVFQQSTSLAPAAEKLHLGLRESGWIQADGRGLEPKDALLGNPKLLASIFTAESTKNNRNTTAVEVSPDVLVAAHVVAHEDSKLRPLEEVKGLIEAQLKKEEATRRVQKLGEQQLADLKAGKAVDLKWTPAQKINRQQSFQMLSGELTNQVFKADAATLPAYAGMALVTGDYGLVKVTAVTPGKTDDATLAKQMRAQLNQIYGNEMMEEFLAVQRAHAEPKVVNKKLLEKPQSNS